jgi:hypothetical protein
MRVSGLADLIPQVRFWRILAKAMLAGTPVPMPMASQRTCPLLVDFQIRIPNHESQYGVIHIEAPRPDQLLPRGKPARSSLQSHHQQNSATTANESGSNGDTFQIIC